MQSPGVAERTAMKDNRAQVASAGTQASHGMRVCDGITYMVIGEAPDLSSVDEEIRHRWNSLSIDTARREPHASETPRLVRNRSSFRNRTHLDPYNKIFGGTRQ